jgi:hypothetical protein
MLGFSCSSTATDESNGHRKLISPGDCGGVPFLTSLQEKAAMVQRHTTSQSTSTSQAAGSASRAGRLDSRAQILRMLQELFEVSRDQFDDSDLQIPEWRQADDAVECVYDACVAHEKIAAIRRLSEIAHRYIDMAVEMSTARSYYDGRI